VTSYEYEKPAVDVVASAHGSHPGQKVKLHSPDSDPNYLVQSMNAYEAANKHVEEDSIL